MNLSELSVQELDLINEALEHLPNKSQAGDMMVDLLGMMLSKGDEEATAKMERDREERRIKAEEEKIKLKESIKILQAKILIMKQNLK
jgi:hypothetical protein